VWAFVSYDRDLPNPNRLGTILCGMTNLDFLFTKSKRNIEAAILKKPGQPSIPCSIKIDCKEKGGAGR
jgi:hypothetical protein